MSNFTILLKPAVVGVCGILGTTFPYNRCATIHFARWDFNLNLVLGLLMAFSSLAADVIHNWLFPLLVTGPLATATTVTFMFAVTVLLLSLHNRYDVNALGVGTLLALCTGSEIVGSLLWRHVLPKAF